MTIGFTAGIASTKLPAPFVALIAMIGDRFGIIHAELPSPTSPHMTFTMVRELVPPAMTIAALGAIEPLLSGVPAA